MVIMEFMDVVSCSCGSPYLFGKFLRLDSTFTQEEPHGSEKRAPIGQIWLTNENSTFQVVAQRSLL